MKKVACAALAVFAALTVAACHHAADGPGDNSAVNKVSVNLAAPQLVVGSVTQATAVLLDALGDTITDRSPAWSSLSPAVVSVTPNGLVTGLQAGIGTVRAISGTAIGIAQVVVKNPSAGSITFSRDTATVAIPGGSTQLIATVRDSTGALIQNPTIVWQSASPLIATVNTTGLVTGVAVGSATITASVDQQSAQATINVTLVPNANAPLIVSVNPEPLRPGGTFTVVGNNFAPTPAGNVVVVDGVSVIVNASTVNALSITLPTTYPCVPAHPVFIQVTANGLIGGGASTLQIGNLRTLGVGQSVVVTDPTQVRCNELDLTGGRYAISVYNAYRSAVTPTANGAVSITVHGAVPASTLASVSAPAHRPNAAAPALMQLPRFSSVDLGLAQRIQRQREIDRQHARVLEQSMEFVRLHAGQARPARSASIIKPPSSISAQVVEITGVGNITSVKVPNLDASNFCVTNTAIGARTVFVGAHSIIVEDTTTIFAGGPTLAGQMDNYYQQLGQEFESVMYPIEVTNFGNPFVMDAQLGNLGKVVMVFSPRVNNTSEGSILGFVVSCDLFPVSTAPSSNFGEYFYAAVPTSTALGYFDPGTRDSWMRQMRPTIIHEVKHITAFAERISHNLPLEDLSWEEGMARNAEELYARTFYGTTARQNTGYAASIGCDNQYASAAPPSPCANRPLLMLRHFDGLYTYFGAPEVVSMLGRTFAQDFTFYASAWAVERWANDIFSTTESQFFKDFTLNSTPGGGVANLEARTGQPWEQSLGEWSLAMYMDDFPGFTPANPHLQFLSWNTPDIWLGMCQDLGPCANPNNPSQLYPSSNPFSPHYVSFGNFSVNVTPLEGGAFSIFDLSGTQSAKQLIEVKSVSGGDPPSTVRIAIVRIQ